MQVCPTCNQPYIRISQLLNPTRTIYVHRETGPKKNPVDYCMGKTAHRDGTSIVDGKPLIKQSHSGSHAGSSTGSSRQIEKNVASQLNTVIKSNQSQMGHNIRTEENKTMAFKPFNVAELREKYPVVGIGRAGKPSVAIMDNGRLQFSSEVTKAFDGCNWAVPAADQANPSRLCFYGLADNKGKEGVSFPLVRPQPKEGKKGNKTVAVNASILMKELGYDFKTAGNQTYEVEKIDLTKHTVIFSLPKELPKRKPKQERKKKAAPATTEATAPVAAQGPVAVAGSGKGSNKANGAEKTPAPVPATPASEDDLIIQE